MTLVVDRAVKPQHKQGNFDGYIFVIVDIYTQYTVNANYSYGRGGGRRASTKHQIKRNDNNIVLDIRRIECF